MKQKKVKHNAKDTTVTVICYILTGLFALACLVPFIYVVSASFSSETLIMREGFSLLPRGFTTRAYQVIFASDQIWKSYGVTIFITAFGTFASLFFTALLAYPLSTGRLQYGSQINFFVYFTMLFSGGLVPSYLLISRYLNLSNTIWVYIIPSLLSVWNMFLLRNFFASIPESLPESARIDGANDFTIMMRIILPCAKPALATIGLFYALGYWNEWYKALLYCGGAKDLWPLQFLIMQMMKKAETVANMAAEGYNISSVDMPTMTMKMATSICTIGPIVLVYPFVQKYFTSGLMVGSVKG